MEAERIHMHDESGKSVLRALVILFEVRGSQLSRRLPTRS